MDIKEELKNKRLKAKSDYLRIELEETQYLFQDSLTQFQKDFSEYLEEFEELKPKEVKRVDGNLEFDIPKEKVNKVFKKIATKTHPDKTLNSDDSDELVELYKEAKESVNKKDWSRVSQIAEQLDIDISDVEENDSVFLEKTIFSIESKINEIKQTFAWLWVNTKEEDRPQLKKHILNVMGVKEKENGNK